MIPGLKRLAAGAIAVLVAAVPLAALAGGDYDNDHDHDRARDLYEHGEIHALRDILNIVEEHVPGDVVSVDLVRVNDAWVYRFQVIATDGRRVTVDIDATAGKFLDAQGAD